MNAPNALSFATFPLFLALTCVEIQLLTYFKKGRYSWPEILVSVGIGAVFFHFLYIIEYVSLVQFSWLEKHRLLDIAPGNIWSNLLLFVGVEFCYYWYHRSSHQIRWLWMSHGVHHTSQHFNLAAACRVSWTSGLSGSFIFYVPLVWIGYHPAVIFTMLSATFIYQVFLHTELIPSLGPIDKIVNTPSNHRVHHGTNPCYRNRNFGNVLIVFDQIFCTYAAEKQDEKSEYGLVKQLNSNHVLVILFHEWWAMCRDVAAAKHWRARLDCLLGKPR